MDGIEQDLGSAAKVVRIEFTTPNGREVGARFGVEFVPTFLLFDARGQLVHVARDVDREGFVRELRARAGG